MKQLKPFSRSYNLYWWLWQKTHRRYLFCVILDDSEWLAGDPPFRARQIIVCDRSGREIGWGVKPKEYCHCEMYTSLKKAVKKVEDLANQYIGSGGGYNDE